MSERVAQLRSYWADIGTSLKRVREAEAVLNADELRNQHLDAEHKRIMAESDVVEDLENAVRVVQEIWDGEDWEEINAAASDTLFDTLLALNLKETHDG